MRFTGQSMTRCPALRNLVKIVVRPAGNVNQQGQYDSISANPVGADSY
jgi:hypothetical protein